MQAHEGHKVSGDGNYFLHAIVGQLNQLRIHTEDGALYTREFLCTLIESRVEEDFRLRVFLTSGEARGRIDDDAVQALVDLLGLNLEVKGEDGSPDPALFRPLALLADDKTLRLIYNKGRYGSPGEDKDAMTLPKGFSCTTILALLSMAACSFGIGSTEFIPAGLLPNLSAAFGVSIPMAAWATSGYAIGVGVSGPLLTAGTICLPRKYVLAGLMALFVLGSITSALAPSFGILMFGRILTSLCHGSFFGIGSVVVSSMVPPNKKASAIALMFTGLTLANVVGVPMGTLLGQSLGWRSAFWAISALGAVGLLGIIAFLPRKLDIPSTHLRQELAVFKQPQVWGALGTTSLGFSGLIACFTYVAPIMEDVAGFPSSDLSWLVALYGVGLVIGNILGGRAADHALKPALYSLLLGLAGVLTAFTFTAHYKIPAAITLFFLGGVGFALVPALVQNVMTKAKDAPTLASTVNISAFNLGIALSVYLGGLTIDAGLGYTSPIWVGALLAISALIIAVISNFKRSATPAQDVDAATLNRPLLRRSSTPAADAALGAVAPPVVSGAPGVTPSV